MIRILLLISLLVSSQAYGLEDDKTIHFAAGAAIGIYDWKVGCGVGVVKELYDSQTGGTVEGADIAYTCAGAIVGNMFTTSPTKMVPQAAGAMLIADWLQTREIATNSEYKETNPRLGEYPTLRAVDHHFAIALGVHMAVNTYVAKRYRPIWNWPVLIVEGLAVIHNKKLGVSFKF